MKKKKTKKTYIQNWHFFDCLSASFEITNLNLNLSLIEFEIKLELFFKLDLKLKLNLKLSWNMSLNPSLGLSLKLNLRLNLNLSLTFQLELYFHFFLKLHFNVDFKLSYNLTHEFKFKLWTYIKNCALTLENVFQWKREFKTFETIKNVFWINCFDIDGTCVHPISIDIKVRWLKLKSNTGPQASIFVLLLIQCRNYGNINIENNYCKSKVNTFILVQETKYT